MNNFFKTLGFLVFPISLYSSSLFKIDYWMIPPKYKKQESLIRKDNAASRPYYMTSKHPMKVILDQLLAEKIFLNLDTFKAAGFEIVQAQPRSLIVAKHPALPGYVVKVYLDDNKYLKKKISGLQWFIYRSKGAKKVAKVIKKKHLKYFIVPKKWIYTHPHTKQSVLLAQEMPILPRDLNSQLWKTTITEEHLNELYEILIQASSIRSRPDNMCFMSDGRIALIDTEYPFKKPDLRTIRKYLSPKMLNYWDSLIRF